MSWTAGSDKVTGDLITAAIWNNYMGASGSLEYLGDRELYVPVTQFSDSVAGDSPLTSRGDFPVANSDNASDEARMSFRCPSDFGAIISAKVVIISAVTDATADWDINTDFGADGENYNANSDSETAATYNATTDNIIELDISSALTGLAANDYVGIKVTGADAFRLVGFYLRYSVA